MAAFNLPDFPVVLVVVVVGLGSFFAMGFAFVVLDDVPVVLPVLVPVLVPATGGPSLGMSFMLILLPVFASRQARSLMDITGFTPGSFQFSAKISVLVKTPNANSVKKDTVDVLINIFRSHCI
ncbi:MAG: hypothetical protein IJ273_01170 [Alphaproteobacteria bacterium]|nr:hypothetical protein [Alphaproteobacteria bacterium]